MLYSLNIVIRVAQNQNSLNFNVPLWIWILLGILLLAIILGLILGERMAENKSFIPQSRYSPSQQALIPLTGAETQINPTELTILHGINVETQQALNSAGINTFQELAQTSIQELSTIIRPVNGRTTVMATWPDQAKLAAAGQWNELRNWQNKLDKSVS